MTLMMMIMMMVMVMVTVKFTTKNFDEFASVRILMPQPQQSLKVSHETLNALHHVPNPLRASNENSPPNLKKDQGAEH